jgi:hypothetical protein
MLIHRLAIPFCALIASCSGGEAQVDANQVPYPEGYRSWTHVKSMVLFEDHPLADPFEGLHHVYANAAALEGLRGGSYADGAILVFDLLEAPLADDTLTEGLRKRIDIMHRDSSRYASTGGWGYETFVGDSRSERLDQDVVSACYACHTSQANQSFVFSQWRP